MRNMREETRRRSFERFDIVKAIGLKLAAAKRCRLK